jgi:hypothetical protein
LRIMCANSGYFNALHFGEGVKMRTAHEPQSNDPYSHVTPI